MNRVDAINRGMDAEVRMDSIEIPSLKGKVSDEEWAIREDLAAAYRMVAHYGWDDLIFTHLSARIPGPEHHFLLNPYQLMFEEVTASSLVKVDVNGNPVDPTPFITNPGGLHDPFGDPHGARGRACRDASPHACGSGGVRAFGRASAADADGDADPRRGRVPRL